jgi:hypothetical protein
MFSTTYSPSQSAQHSEPLTGAPGATSPLRGSYKAIMELLKITASLESGIQALDA